MCTLSSELAWEWMVYLYKVLVVRIMYLKDERELREISVIYRILKYFNKRRLNLAKYAHVLVLLEAVLENLIH